MSNIPLCPRCDHPLERPAPPEFESELEPDSGEVQEIEAPEEDTNIIDRSDLPTTEVDQVDEWADWQATDLAPLRDDEPPSSEEVIEIALPDDGEEYEPGEEAGYAEHIEGAPFPLRLDENDTTPEPATPERITPQIPPTATGLEHVQAPPTARIERPYQPPDATQARRQPYFIPPAPYTPPPIPAPRIAPPLPVYPPAPYTAPSSHLQQRVQAYRQGGYRVLNHTLYEATLSRGKYLGFFGWVLAIVSIIGLLWYVLLMVVSGLRPDRAYLALQADGSIYEDGPGAAYIRHQRSRIGRRWSITGLVMFAVAFVLALGLVIVALLALDRYKPALRAAYPEITLFEDWHSDTPADAEDVSLVETGAVVFSILTGIAVLGLWIGLTMVIVGTIHAIAYHVDVPPG